MIPDYNRVASYYDRLAKFVYGNKLELAKKAHLNLIEDGSSILIVGGGTGRILEYLEENGCNVHVDYVEVSSGMIKRAKKRQLDKVKSNFYQNDIMAFEGGNYQYIITNFFFDQYNLRQAKRVLNHLCQKLSEDGSLLFSDFVHSSKFYDKLMLKIMYLYFRNVAKLDKIQLIDHKSLFGTGSLQLVKSVNIKSNIRAEVYKKSSL